MSTINPALGRVLAGIGGAALIAALFLPWAGYPGAIDRTGWQLLQTADVLCLLTGLAGIVTAITGGRFGFFRPDLAFGAATDLLGVLTTSLLAWLLFVDFPSHASRGAGGYLALIAAFVCACGAGDFRISSLFPSLAANAQTTGRGSTSRI
ncbi:MAG: hypothetical protein QOI82_1442 [Actinomycetota bacterium]|jgi:hypothetical protein|nr:hypothetical protein [Actinomycetota bacterium]